MLTLLAAPELATAKCGYSQIEVRGTVRVFAGEPLAGASVIAFVDSDSRLLLDLESDEETATTDSSGSFVLRGAFVDYAWPRWWHRWSRSVDVCGREPGTLTLIVRKEGFFGRRVSVTADSGVLQRTSEGRYLAELRDPIELLTK